MTPGYYKATILSTTCVPGIRPTIYLPNAHGIRLLVMRIFMHFDTHLFGCQYNNDQDLSLLPLPWNTWQFILMWVSQGKSTYTTVSYITKRLFKVLQLIHQWMINIKQEIHNTSLNYKLKVLRPLACSEICWGPLRMSVLSWFNWRKLVAIQYIEVMMTEVSELCKKV